MNSSFNFRVAALACAVAGASLLTSAAAYSRGGDDWQALHRALHLPQADATHCPTATKPARLGRGIWNGGPAVYLESVGRTAKVGVIDLTQSPPDTDGWRRQKTPWLLPRSYRGPVLVRGARIDAQGSIALAKVHSDHLQELRYATGFSNGYRDRSYGFNGSYRFIAATTLLRAPGCYAFQVDGTTFSAVIVMRATLSDGT
jgi:hypothetical protein